MSTKPHLIPVSIFLGKFKVLLFFFIKIYGTLSIHYLRKTDDLILETFTIETLRSN